MRLRRRVAYQWRLREVMATRGLFTTTELVPLLAERGITLSASQVHRLVTGTPERLSLPVLAALCDILEVTPTELIATRAENLAPPPPSPASRRCPWWTRPPPCGPSAPASDPRDEPGPHAGAVRPLAQTDLRTLRPARLVRRPLA
jgi:DNA-binding Xre family transcriptional regulator